MLILNIVAVVSGTIVDETFQDTESSPFQTDRSFDLSSCR
jgi:hypothetical protein